MSGSLIAIKLLTKSLLILILRYQFKDLTLLNLLLAHSNTEPGQGGWSKLRKGSWTTTVNVTLV